MGLLAPFQTGELQKAYYDLEPDADQDCEKLKGEILAPLGITIAIHAQQVHSTHKPPCPQMFDSIHLTKTWLQSETLSAPKVVDYVVMDFYL